PCTHIIHLFHRALQLHENIPVEQPPAGIPPPIRIDIIVTAGGIYVCDAKNYSGDYVYADGRWYAGGRLLNRDIFVQLKRSMEKVNDMCTRIGPDIRAEGAVVFVNEHFELEMESSVFERVVMRNRIRKYLVEIGT